MFIILKIFQHLEEEKAELFPKKDISNQKKNYVSELSKLLKACPYLPLNPFREYSKYDGNVNTCLTFKFVFNKIMCYLY